MELGNDSFLAAASAISDHLVERALWGADQCTWLSADGPGDRARSLDPWLYGGDSGVALFLSEAARITGSRIARRAARGASLRALATVQQRPRAPGLYEGTLGVALAAARVALTIGDEQILEAAHAVALVKMSPKSAVGADLMTGSAGEILALVTLAHELAEPQLLTEAEECAAKLVEAADTHLGMSWASIDPQEPSLTGLAHGAAAAVMALSELFRATGAPTLLQAIEACCAFERSHYSESNANWVDRRLCRRRRRASAPDRFMVAWCHGGPGIALSRMSAFVAARDSTRLAEALVGTRTAVQRLASASDSRSLDDWSLCHGLGGLIDIVGEYERLDRASPGGATDLARMVAADHATQFRNSVSWPCGTNGRQTPGLMVGLAGVGLTYLRLADSQIPSALWIRPQLDSSTV